MSWLAQLLKLLFYIVSMGFASCNYLNAVVSPLQLNLSIKDFSMSHCFLIERVHYTSNRSWDAGIV